MELEKRCKELCKVNSPTKKSPVKSPKRKQSNKQSAMKQKKQKIETKRQNSKGEKNSKGERSSKLKKSKKELKLAEIQRAHKEAAWMFTDSASGDESSEVRQLHMPML